MPKTKASSIPIPPPATPALRTERPAGDGPRRLLINAVKGMIGVFFLVYIAIRIVTVEICGDEFPYPFPIADIFALKNLEEQLQPLIYVLSTLSKSLFKIDEVIAIRLPCIPIFMAYAWVAAWVTRRIRPAGLELLAFTALLSNPFALDFFGLQRGYGLAMLFVLLSAGFAVEQALGPPERRGRHAAWAVWTGSFAVLGNLACLHYYLGLCLWLVWGTVDWTALRAGGWRPSAWGQMVRRVWWANQYLIANGLMLGIFWLPRIILLVQGDELYSGGQTGFVHDTVGSFVACSLYDIAAPAFHNILAPLPVTLGLARGISIISSLIALDAFRRRRRTPAMMACWVFSALLLLMVASIQAQHHLGGIRYIWERATLTLLPLWVGQMVLYVAALAHPVARTAGVAAVAAYITLFPLNANLTHTRTWHMMSHNRALLAELTRLRAEAGLDIVILGLSDSTKPKLDYYKNKAGIDWLQWYPVDMYTRFNGQYMIHPQTHYFFFWHQGGVMPEALRELPLEPVPGADFSGAQCVLYRVRPGAELGRLLQPFPAGTESR